MREAIKELRDEGFPVGVADMSGTPPRKYPTGVSRWQDLPSIARWPKYPVEGCFMRTGEIEVVDVDSKHWKEDGDFSIIFGESLKVLSFYDKLVCYKTISGGRQYPYYCNNATGSKKLAKRLTGNEAILETRGKGGLAVCPPTVGYEWLDGGEFEAIPTLSDEERNELIEHCMNWNEGLTEEVDLSEAREYKENTGKPGDDWASKNDFIGWIKGHGWAVERVVGTCVLLRRPDKKEGVSASWNYEGLGRFYCWSSSTKLPTQKMLKPFAVKAYLEHDGDFKACAMDLRQDGYGNDALALVEACEGAKNWGEVGLILQENKKKLNCDFPTLSLGLQAMGIKGVTEAKIKALKGQLVKTETIEWEEQLTRDEDEKVKGKIYNIDLILNNDPKYQDIFKYDNFSQSIVLYKNNKRREFDDSYQKILRVRLGQTYGHFRAEDIEAVVLDIAKRNQIHPLQDHIKSVQWDGRPRAETWLTRYCGAKDSEYVRTIGKKWLIGAIARLFRPGCKFDNILILEGLQGVQKSTILRKLSYDYFLDGSLDIKSKDGLMALFGKWIVEFSELEGMNGRTAEQIKAFLAKQEDRVRRPYSRTEEIFERTCVFAGTTNKSQYLDDDSGNRRFWPVQIAKAKIDDIELDRDQLWAEAFELFEKGESWWVDEESDQAQILRGEQGERVSHDELADEIMNWASTQALDDGRICIKLKDLWTDVYKGDVKTLDRKKQIELGTTLRKLGFDKGSVTIKGVRVKVWIYKGVQG